MCNFVIPIPCTMKISGKKIKLRALEPSDVELLYRWENDTNNWNVSNTLTPYSKHVLEQYIANAHLDIYTTKQLRLVICDNKNIPLGCIDLFDFDPNHRRAGVGILIADKKNQTRGYASEALFLLINYCFGTLNLHQLYCNITIDNKTSLALFKKYRFKITGTKKSGIRDGNIFKDEYLLQLINKV